MSTEDDNGIEIIGAPDPNPMTLADEDDDTSVTDLVQQPAKVMRIGTMIKQLLEEVKAAPLDDASRNRLREIHKTSIRELEEGLAPELRDELERLALPFSDDVIPSDAELRIAQAQLVGWLEGLFHGIQTALFAQQMAARAQLEQMRQGALPPGEAVRDSAVRCLPRGPGNTFRRRDTERHATGTDPYIETRDAWVEFPIFDAKSRSLKKAFLGKAGGTIGRNSSNVVVVEALREITMSLQMGDRVGLVGHNGAGKSTLLRLLSGIYEPTRGVATVAAGWPRCSTSVSAWTRRSPASRTSSSAACSWARPASRCWPRWTRSPSSPSWASTCPCRCAPTPPVCGCGWRWAWSPASTPRSCCSTRASAPSTPTSSRRPSTRLQGLVERSGILVFASHSNEFLARLCKTAMWIDHGTIRMAGGIEDVVRAYEGEDAARHVRDVLRETAHTHD